MDVIKICAVDARTIFLQRRTEDLLRSLPVAPDHCFREKADAPQIVCEPKRIEHFHRVRRHLDPGADLAELSGALEQMDVDVMQSQRASEGYAADPAPDDADAKRQRFLPAVHCIPLNLLQFSGGRSNLRHADFKRLDRADFR